MDYVKSRKIDLDIVVVMDEELYSGEPIKTHIDKVLSKVVYMTYTRGNIYTVNVNTMPENERGIFDFVSRLKIDGVDIFMPKKTKEKPMSEVDVNEL